MFQVFMEHPRIYPQDVESEEVYQSMLHANVDFYVSWCFKTDFFVNLIVRGFIPVTARYDILVPQFHRNFAVMHELKIPKKLRHQKLTRMYREEPLEFRLNTNICGVLEGIRTHHKNCWLEPAYINMVLDLYKHSRQSMYGTPVNMISVELYKDGTLIAGEIGYQVGLAYCSLSGFCLRGPGVLQRAGKIQLTLLAKILEIHGIISWSLGCPPSEASEMKYKADLGCQEMSRLEYVDWWKAGCQRMATRLWTDHSRNEQALVLCQTS